MQRTRAKRGEWRRWVFEQLESADPESCWVWPFHTQSAGYGQARWRGSDRQATRIVHEFAFGFPPPDDLFACHICDVPRCVNPNHVFYGTNAENLADMRGKRRHAFGGQNGRAKLSDEIVREIRGSAEAQDVLAERFGVDQSVISKVKSHKIWNHVN